VVNGDISAVGEIQIDGTITGNLRAAQITVGQTATIRGDVMAEEVTVRGHVVGTITGRRVHLSGTAFVEGDIRHQSMGMEMGARLDGCCRHAADPLALAAPIAPAASPKPVSLARAALKTEDRSSAFSAAPNVDLTPTESRSTATASEPSINKGNPSSFGAPAAAPDASVSPDAGRPPVNDLEDLKSTGLKMRARTSKPSLSASARKPSTMKSDGAKPDGLEPAPTTEGKTAAPPRRSYSFSTQPSGADLQSDASPEPQPLRRAPVVG
jgi:cytoskeletal protein CcmA (bactofilin family)